MRIALVASPFITIPPRLYGGTELFIAHLARGLQEQGHDVVVYATGDSQIPVEVRFLYSRSEWPIESEAAASLKENNHTAWAIRDASESCDIIHVNNVVSLSHCREVSNPFVYTVHHHHEEALSKFYAQFPEVQFVAISDFQRRRERIPNMQTIHHGIDLTQYRFKKHKKDYLTFLGRVAPIKGTHLAIEVAKKSGIPLKIAGEIQPIFRDYYEREVKPHIDGKFIEYVGEVNLEQKNELLGDSLAMLFPIQWNEPFGLVTIESMACGTPVLALPGGSVAELVRNGISGYVGKSVDELARYATRLDKLIRAEWVRSYVEQNFSVEHMTARYEQLYTATLATKTVDAVPELELMKISGQEATPA
jgi:glycosyltransferase involved in cell wall biosynthesis